MGAMLLSDNVGAMLVSDNVGAMLVSDNVGAMLTSKYCYYRVGIKLILHAVVWEVLKTSKYCGN